MAATIIDGSKVAAKVLKELGQKVKSMKQKPGLAAVLVGNNPASQIYVAKKEKTCKELGFYSEKHELPETISEEKLLQLIDQLNQNQEIHGILVQLPLPKHINSKLVIDSILPHKDADGFTPINMGNMLIGNNLVIPSTPKGIMRLIDEYKILLDGKHAVVVGRSNIVGKPISVLLQQRNCTVTMCHSRTKNLGFYTKQADILIVAVGQPKLITKDMVKKNAVVIDVGVNRLENGKLVGDVDFENVKKVASYITPVPGGIGPMTIAMLMENTLECMELVGK